MKKYILLIITVVCLSVFMLTAYAEDVEVTYGKGKMNLTLVDDFSKSVAGSTSFGTVTVEDAKILLESTTFADIYGITVPDSEENKTLYTGVKYIAISIKNVSEDDVYFCFQPQVSASDNKFLNSNSDTYLLDKTGVRLDVEWSEEASVNARYAFIVPGSFEGYTLIPVNAIATINDWDTPIWQEGSYISAVGFHASPAYGGEVNLELDNLFVLAELPTYEPLATPEPSPTPEATNTPEPTEAEATATATAPKETPKAKDSSDNKDIILIASIVALVVVIGIVVFVVIKKKKHK